MTKTAARKLVEGQEVFNLNTGEVAYFISSIGTVGSTIYIESVDNDGLSYIWSHKDTERV